MKRRNPFSPEEAGERGSAGQAWYVIGADPAEGNPASDDSSLTVLRGDTGALHGDHADESSGLLAHIQSVCHFAYLVATLNRHGYRNQQDVPTSPQSIPHRFLPAWRGHLPRASHEMDCRCPPDCGCKRLEADSHEYQMLRSWIVNGARLDAAAPSTLTRLTMTPAQQTLKNGDGFTLKIEATFADGSKEDVTGSPGVTRESCNRTPIRPH